MARFRSLLALALLAVLTVGGTLAPAVHRAVHADETAETRAQHIAADHHHHQTREVHGTEIVPPCPEPLDAHLTCVLCTVASGGVTFAEGAPLAPEATTVTRAVQDDRPTETETGAQSARGPPAS